MTAHDDCRRVLATSHLGMARPPSAGVFVAGPPRLPRAARAITLPPLAGAPRKEIRRRVGCSLCGVVPDRSGSIFSTWGGDPDDAIGAAGESLFLLQRRSGGGQGLVVPWGSTAPRELVVGPLDTRRHSRPLRTALRNRGSLGGNDLPAALHRTAEYLVGRPADEIPVIFVPTDGGETVTAATHAAVTALPEGSVHLILIDPRNICSPEMEADWRSVAFGSFNRIDDLSVRHLATRIAEIYAAALGLELDSATTAPTRTGRQQQQR